MIIRKYDKISWAIGGSLIIGLGVGFIFLQTSPLLFIASIMIGLGVGLLLAPIIMRNKE
jgi:F0F1-type ATP synthase assembly protein I